MKTTYKWGLYEDSAQHILIKTFRSYREARTYMRYNEYDPNISEVWLEKVALDAIGQLDK